MPRDGALPSTGPSQDSLAKLNLIRGALTEDTWVRKTWRNGGRRCLGQMLLDVYRTHSQQELPYLPLTSPILAAAKQVTGTPFADIVSFNDNVPFPTICKVLNRARENISGMTEKVPDSCQTEPPAQHLVRQLVAAAAAGLATFCQSIFS